MAASRRLSAVMFTDLVGFTTLTQGDEATALRLVEEHNRLLRPIFERFHGREVKSMGDGFLVEFDSALEATRCAVEVQRELHERNTASPEGATIRVRIGVHLGDVVRSDGDILGDAVNLASRLQPLAEPGGVCVSEQVYVQVGNKIPESFERLGPQQLKNVRLPVEAYRIALPWEKRGGSDRAPAPGRVAVLPFVNMSPDPNDEFFADGMTEELIGKLSELQGLKVIARTSVMSYKHKEKRLLDIGRELGVSALIEGSVRRSGQRLRVRVQLVDASTEEHRWASNYDESLDDIFAIQSDVAAKVADALAREVLPARPRAEPENLEAYTDFLQASQLLHQDTEPALRTAAQLFERAAEREPTFARAHLGVAQAWAALVLESFEDWPAVSRKAEPAAKRALELDPDLGEAHAALASIYTLLDRSSEAKEEVRRAIALNPNLSDAFSSLGTQHSAEGDLDAAIGASRRAFELDPLSVRKGVGLAWLLQMAGRPTEALALLENLDRLHPDDVRVLDGLAEYHRLSGDLGGAERVLTDALRAHPKSGTLLTDLAVVRALAGRRADAEATWAEAAEVLTDAGRTVGLLYLRTAMGDLDGAFRALSELARIHSWPGVIGVHPLFAPLREDPRYVQFAQSVGIPARRPPSSDGR